MGNKSGIQWTDATWNPTTGCTRVSAGCDHCYAFQLHDQRHEAWKAGRFPDAPKQYHRPFSEVQLIPERLALPLRWTKPRRIFVDSMADLFHPDVPTDFIADVFAVMAMARRHTFQILTKRPQRMHRLVSDRTFHARVIDACYDIVHRRHLAHGLSDSAAHVWPLHNVWLGTSVENQEATYRIDFLVETPAAVRFLSCEPLIGPLDLGRWLWDDFTGYSGAQTPYEPSGTLHWVITGGESGPGHRQLDPRWVAEIRDQCKTAGIAYFHKQNGGRTPKAGGRELDGRTWDEFPAVAS